MKHAFVTGGTGFVGLNLIHGLKQQGWKVTALHRASSSLEFIRRFDVDLIQGDTADADSLTAMPEGVDAVFHVAPQLAVRCIQR